MKSANRNPLNSSWGKSVNDSEINFKCWLQLVLQDLACWRELASFLWELASCKALSACSCHVHNLPGGVAYAGPRVNHIGQFTENVESKRNDHCLLVRVRGTYFDAL